MCFFFKDALKKLKESENKLQKQNDLQPLWDSTVKGLHQDLRKRNKEVRGQIVQPLMLVYFLNDAQPLTKSEKYSWNVHCVSIHFLVHTNNWV